MGKITDAATKFYDGFAQVMSGLGGSADTNAHGTGWFMRPISQQEIEASFRTSWLSRKIHTIPVTDQIRPWRKWNATPEQITAIEKEESRLGLRQKVRKALLWSRLFGGAVIVLGIEGDDPRMPLDVTKVRKAGLSYIHVLSRHEVTITQINLDPGSPQYGEPLSYNVNTGGSLFPIHPSRVVRFTNADLPDNITFADSGWSDPLLVSVRDALVNADGAQGNFAALTSKARTSTLKIPGLVNLISTTDGEQKLIRKTQLAKQYESMFHVNLISAPARQGEAGEEYENEAFSFANIPEMGTWFVQMVAGAADVPMTRISGMSPGGMNSTGQHDSDNYWTMLDAGRELDLRPRLEMIDEALIRSATGARDPAIWFSYLPFEVETEAVRAGNAKLRADAVKQLADSNTVPGEVLMKAVKGLLIDGGEYPGIEEAYNDYEKTAELAPIEEPEAANDNPAVLAAATEGLSAQGKSASVAARDAIALCDSVPRPLYVSRPLLNGDDLAAWARDNGLNPIDTAKMHVTVAFSRQPLDWMQLGSDDWSGEGVTVFGGPRMLERFGPERKVIVLAFSSSRLSYRHEEILRAGASWDWPEYQAHVTIDYDAPDDIDIDAIKPFTGELRFGVERFEQLDTDWNSDD